MDALFRQMRLEHIQSMKKFRVLAEEAFVKLQDIAENVGVIRSTTVSVGMPDEQVELAKKTFHRAKSVVIEKRKTMPSIPEWFIPRDAVDFEDEYFDRGMYAVMHKGIWGQDGHGTEVAVKCLVVDDEKAQDEFKRESKVWFGLDHPNVVKMYGACNEGLPIFFVCEYVEGKNFANHFEDDKSHLWRLFYKAALGLRYLHDNKVIHGDLKCNNILVDGKDNAKICDFGFSYIRSRSIMNVEERTQEIRWQAPEVLLVSAADPDADTNPRFASDVFSLGMCIIEALTGEPPYEFVDDDVVMGKVFEGEACLRPEGTNDDEWEFVQQLCEHTMFKRISLPDALDKLKLFADQEAANIGKLCLVGNCNRCDTSVLTGAKFCCECGLDLTKQKRAPSS
ncbi:hypothetical protein BBJ29_003604 [Phytophthora kernoviae]|uniref:Protein kinase domain-containing protein n=1 Tax=Phytophthora kernoviae TaxID=325452 RepID=A0A3F2RJU8_9STRA|nr:hypothetical protein BBJ29_003604 [Phytophthora kernoviae]RLN58616.1 hypothetical protein BBP00_00006915 [Phytophthora kernoviae]